MSEKNMADSFKKAKKKVSKKSNKEVEALTARNAELVAQLQRLQAEFENYKKRTDKENETLRKFAKKDFIKELLPLIDTLELGLAHKDKTEEFVNGVEMIFKQLGKLLENEGVRKIDCVGQKFDPYKHDVMLTEETDGEEDIILQELQRGYMLKEMVLRHAKVKVSTKKETTEDIQTE